MAGRSWQSRDVRCTRLRNRDVRRGRAASPVARARRCRATLRWWMCATPLAEHKPQRPSPRESDGQIWKRRPEATRASRTHQLHPRQAAAAAALLRQSRMSRAWPSALGCVHTRQGAARASARAAWTASWCCPQGRRRCCRRKRCAPRGQRRTLASARCCLRGTAASAGRGPASASRAALQASRHSSRCAVGATQCTRARWESRRGPCGRPPARA